MHAVLTWLTDPWLTPKFNRISKAISYATKVFGYSELRPNQELAVKHFLCSHNVFGIAGLPTGSGKSLCHCLLPKAFYFLWQRIESTQSIVVVVSSRSCPQISEAYVVSRGKTGRDDALKSCLRLPVLRSEAAQRMQNTETDAIIGKMLNLSIVNITTYFIPNVCHHVFQWIISTVKLYGKGPLTICALLQRLGHVHAMRLNVVVT